ncbi:MAG: hypothetical protein PF961_22400 [Planctomycetota bacterium]|jgi:hypothetical protein|nr:hypothetical protein [Planctomycetota bacterium]
MLIDRHNDPRQLRNVAAEHPEACAVLRAELNKSWDPAALHAQDQVRRAHEAIFAKWGAQDCVPEPDRWTVPESSWVLPSR